MAAAAEQSKPLIGTEWELKAFQIKAPDGKKRFRDAPALGLYHAWAATKKVVGPYGGIPLLAITEDEGGILEIVSGPVPAEEAEQAALGNMVQLFLTLLEDNLPNKNDKMPLELTISKYNALQGDVDKQLCGFQEWCGETGYRKSVFISRFSTEERSASMHANVSLPFDAYMKDVCSGADEQVFRLFPGLNVHKKLRGLSREQWQQELAKVLPQESAGALAGDQDVRAFFTYLFLWSTVQWMKQFDMKWTEGSISDANVRKTYEMFSSEKRRTHEKNVWGLLLKTPLNDVLRAIRDPSSRECLARWYGGTPQRQWQGLKISSLVSSSLSTSFQRCLWRSGQSAKPRLRRMTASEHTCRSSSRSSPCERASTETSPVRCTVSATQRGTSIPFGTRETSSRCGIRTSLVRTH
mmetsp:Transcript_112817/g.329700  ORF Transcript_112817/g.329700 Transcript_112817/m.329700 type:complete len:410 (+) Transcript_112817:55-1284(+)